MTVLLKNAAESTIYTFPGNIECTVQDFSVKTNIAERSHADGGFQLGDGKIRYREIELSGIVTAASQALLETELKKMRYNCENVASKASKLYLSQITDEYYIPGVLESFTADQSEYSVKCAEVDISFICLDPFRYEKGATYPHTQQWSVLSGWSQHNITTNSYTAEMPPLIRVTVELGTLSAFWVRVSTNSDVACGFPFPLIKDEYVEIDSGAGTVICYGSSRFKNTIGVDMIKYFTGVFPVLKAGSNTVNKSVQTPGSTSMKFSWRERWL